MKLKPRGAAAAALCGAFGIFALNACGNSQDGRSEAKAEGVTQLPSSFELRLSQALLAPLAVRNVDEITPINECDDQACYNGQAEQIGATQLELRESEDEGLVDTLYFATTVTSTQGYSDPATFWTTANTSSGSRKQLFLGVDEIKTLPANTNANTSMSIDGVDVDVGLFYNIALNRAWNEVAANVPQAEWQISQRTADLVSARIDSDEEAAIAGSGLRDFQASAQRLRDGAGLGDRVHFASTAQSLSMDVRASVATANPAPEGPADADATVLVNEAFIRDAGTNAFGGKTLTDSEIREQMQKTFGALWDPSGTTPVAPVADGSQFNMTFPAANPLTAVIDSDKVVLTISGVKFKTPNNNYELPMNISATYKIVADGGLKFKREGNLSILPPGFDPAHDQLTLKQKVLAGELFGRFSPVFKEEVAQPELALPGALANSGKLLITKLDAASGWLVAAWKRQAQ